MKTVNIHIALLLLVLAVTGCVKKEGAITPGQEPEPIFGDFTLPQGNHEYDDEIVAFYKKYNTLILYKYEKKDIFWNITNSITEVSYDATTNRTSKGSQYIPADENYIRPQLELLKEQIFKYFPDEFLKANLPRKIFLMDKYLLINAGTGTPDQQTKTAYAGVFGLDFLAATGGGPDITNMTAEQKRAYRFEIINLFLQRVTANGGIKRIPAFTDLTNYSLSMPTYAIQYGNGIIDWYNRTPTTDWDAYVKMLLTTRYEALIAPNGWWHPGIDNKGTIRKKSDVLINYFKTKYNIDLQAIANDL